MRGSPEEVLTLETSQGPARVHLSLPATGMAAGSLLLGHGAGGGVDAADLQALTALAAEGWLVALVEQPWKVAGGRVATRPPRLDAAWQEVVPQLTEVLTRPFVVGGRSAGARVACRTCVADRQAGETEAGSPQRARGAAGLPRADGVLCLAFPLAPPGRPERSRADELQVPLGHGIPTLVVQGARDGFGTPEQVRGAVTGDGLTVVEVPGTHSPTSDLPRLVGAVRGWLGRLSSLR